MTSTRRILSTVNRYLPAVSKAVKRARWKLLMLTKRYRQSRQQYLPAAVEVLREIEPDVAETIARAQVGVWAEAAHQTAKTLPRALPVKPYSVAPPWEPPRKPPITVARPFAPDPNPGEDRLILPVKSAEYLRTRLDFTPEEFEGLTDDARQVGFTVARAANIDAVRSIREALAVNLESGGNYGQFRGVVEEALGRSALAGHRVESLYRTQAGRAYSAGQQAILNHPLVVGQFPYLLYSATHDSRVRPEHLALEKMGLNGTAVYRADDPIWDLFYPPWSWSCRCVVIPLSVADAASYGVREAKEWLKTGRPPSRPEYVGMPMFRPDAKWVPTGQRITSAFV